MRPVTFVICAAGRGERFRERGITISKPKILLKGLTMLERSLASLNRTPIDQVIVIGLENDNLKESFPHLKNIDWLNIQDTSKGQLQTFLSAKEWILHEDIVIYNCDTFFESKSLRELIESGTYDGVIPCSPQPGNCWSFAKVDNENNVIEVAEKERISPWASVGYYYFKDKKLLIELAVMESTSFSGKEAYVAPLYNRYLERGRKLKMIITDSFLPFGTFEQVQNYWGISEQQLISENQK